MTVFQSTSEATGVPPIAEVADGATDGVTVVVTDGVTDGVTGEVTAVVSNGVTDGVTGEMIMEVLMAHLGALDGTGHFDGDFSILSFLLYLHLDATESFAALFSNFSIRWFKAWKQPQLQLHYWKYYVASVSYYNHNKNAIIQVY